MIRNIIQILFIVFTLAVVNAACEVTVTIEADSAKAVLMALRNSELREDDALKIARMYGNQGIIRKMNEFNIPSTTQSFADALFAAAHDRAVIQPAETIFDFTSLKPRVQKLLDLIERITDHPEAFQSWAEQRVALFSPPNDNIRLEGHIVAGGDGGGYTFDGPILFLNIGIEDEFESARTVMAHELYHAVQGSLSVNDESGRLRSDATDLNGRARRQACATSAKLFADVYKEGSAMYVEDFFTLALAPGPVAKKMYADRTSGVRHIYDSLTLLELSVTGLNARAPVSFDNVYSLAFYGQGILYNAGYVMSKAIAEEDGPQGLATYLKQHGYEFAIHYTKLSKYGVDKDHPKLGLNTTAQLARLSNGCQ